VSASFAFSTENLCISFVGVLCMAIVLIFWIMDGFFIATERQYRDLYAEVSKKTESEIDFNMDVSKYKKGNRTWISGMFSKTLVSFYCILALSTTIGIFLK
jgi:hypothetical protein